MSVSQSGKCSIGSFPLTKKANSLVKRSAPVVSVDMTRVNPLSLQTASAIACVALAPGRLDQRRRSPGILDSLGIGMGKSIIA